MDLDTIKVTFFAECVEQLSELEIGLFTISSDGPDIDIVNSVFRAVHSIKGGAGAFGLDDLVSFAHVFENALDIIRNDVSQSSEARIELLLRASDVLADIVTVAREGGEVIDASDISSQLANEFNLNMEVEEEIEFDVVPISLDDFDLDVDIEAPKNEFSIQFAPSSELYLHGNDPQRIFRELQGLGDLVVTPSIDNVSTLDKFDLKQTELSWTLSLKTGKSEDEVKAVFEWVDDCCTLSVEQVISDEVTFNIDDFLDGPSPFVEPEEDDEIEPALVELNVEPEVMETTPDAEVIKLVAPVTKSPKPAEKTKSAKPIRVDSDKVDKLINLMGELVISQSMLSLQVNDSGFGPASTTGLALVALQNLTREIQSSVMAIRAQPIKPVFMRMSRVVREVSGATGKKANLVLVGENTEVDTTVIEGLSDPLTHMIRNSVDHGIEDVETRLKAGKPEQGEIKLSASHSSGRIVIEIIDDGAGINRAKVLEKAIEKGVVAPDAKLSDEDIDNLIFAPGFSTADEVTDVSGRGVGMDVVRQSIQSLGGRVTITSKPGEGSHFTLSLPLTLAILDGMLVKEAGQMFVLPVSSVIETISLRPDDIFRIGSGHLFCKLRNQLVPIVDVGFELGFAEARAEFTQGTIIIVESGKNAMSAFVVEGIECQQQVVIKSMESNYQRIPSIAAATILGNGQIALILDVDEIVTRKVQETPTPLALEKIA